MGIEFLPRDLRRRYEIHESRHACSILRSEFPDEWKELIDVLRGFRLCKSHLTTGGGNKSKIATAIDEGFYDLGWEEKSFATKIVVDEDEIDSPTHKVDCFKNRVGVEIEWNNKDPFYDRDLNNFRLLFELRALSVGVIITRCDELQELFRELGRGSSYGAATTHMGKLLPKLEGGGAGGCPILIFGITRKLYDDAN